MKREEIIQANQNGLDSKNEFWSFRTPVLNIALELGRKGVDLTSQPNVTGYRYGYAPDDYVSFNHTDRVTENGLSMASVQGEKEIGSSVWFCDRKKVEYSGILLPYRGSDGEALILCFDAENWGD